MEERFKDENLTLYFFSEKILVHCPKCGRMAKVHNHLKEDLDAEISCSHCGYYNKNNKVYFSLEFTRNCPDCGNRISFTIPKVKCKKQIMRMPCDKCGFVEDYTPNYIRHKVVYGDIQDGRDYFFNAELWLKKEYKGNLFWATNYEHLEYLERYIGAKLRERNNRIYTTMVEKLPQFIKSNKNRESLLKLIHQLQLK